MANATEIRLSEQIANTKQIFKSCVVVSAIANAIAFGNIRSVFQHKIDNIRKHWFFCCTRSTVMTREARIGERTSEDLVNGKG